MNSCLYECDIMHHRFAPREHRFAYRIFMFAFDLDELETLHRKLRWFSLGRRNVYSFRDSDYLPTAEPLHNSAARPEICHIIDDNRLPPSPPAPWPGAMHPDHCHIIDDKFAGLKARVTAHLATRGIDLTGGRVMLVTLPRIFGYLFNPVSFYFCYDHTGEPVATLAEVTNTFREMKPFLLGPETRELHGGESPRGDAATFRLRTPKYFYVSPFSDMDVDFDFKLRTPNGRLAIQIDDYEAGRRTLTSTLTGARTELTDRKLAWFTLKYPLLTLRIIGLIHWHAFKLWLKKVPWFAKDARPDAQRELYRPHSSIAQSASARSSITFAPVPDA